jgi:glycosyltransferase involved in cell wall biosynthesis
MNSSKGTAGNRCLTAVFSAPFLGGSELFNLEYLRCVRDQGIEIDALIPERGKLEEALQPLVRSLQVVRVPASLQQISRFDRRLRASHAAASAAAGLGYAVRLRLALQRTHGPLVCFGLRAQLAIGLLRPSLPRKVSWVIHEVVPDGAFAAAWGRAAKRVDEIYGYSKSAATQPNLRGAEVRVMAVRLPLACFAQLPPPAPPPHVLGLIGDLFPLKNHLALVQVVRSLRERGFSVEGVLVGRDQTGEKDSIDDYARAVHAAADDPESHVRLVSATPERMPEVISSIDVLLHLSTIPETFGRVCAEAMAAARPVIGYAHGAVAEVVIDGVTGALCTPNHTSAVERAFVELYEDQELFRRLSEQARSHAVREYGEDQRSPTIAEGLADFALSESSP